MAAPLTCTDLLAMDSVPGTLSTNKAASFCLVSVTVTSLRPETKIKASTEPQRHRLDKGPAGFLRCWQGGSGTVCRAAGGGRSRG